MLCMDGMENLPCTMPKTSMHNKIFVHGKKREF